MRQMHADTKRLLCRVTRRLHDLHGKERQECRSHDTACETGAEIETYTDREVPSIRVLSPFNLDFPGYIASPTSIDRVNVTVVTTWNIHLDT